MYFVHDDIFYDTEKLEFLGEINIIERNFDDGRYYRHLRQYYFDGYDGFFEIKNVYCLHLKWKKYKFVRIFDIVYIENNMKKVSVCSIVNDLLKNGQEEKAIGMAIRFLRIYEGK